MFPDNIDFKSTTRPQPSTGSYVPPYVEFMQFACGALELTSGARRPKAEIESWLESNWRHELGEPTKAKVRYMATFSPGLWFGQIIAGLEEKKVGLRILDLGIDTNTPTGRLMLNVLGSVAQFEREMMLERQREGIAKAKAEKRYKGRAPTARAKADQIRLLAAHGLAKREIAKQLGIGERSVFRVLADCERTRPRGDHSSDASASCWFAERPEDGCPS